MSDQIILQITNRHGAGCGAPPHSEERPGRYIGYFENEFGEQWLFVLDRDSAVGVLRGGDADWERDYRVVDGVAEELILGPPERAWLQACWTAATAGRGVRSIPIDTTATALHEPGAAPFTRAELDPAADPENSPGLARFRDEDAPSLEWGPLDDELPF